MKKNENGFMSTVKVGPKGQIVIPKEVREMFEIEPGDSLILFADKKRGIGIQKTNVLSKIAETIFGGKGKEIYPNEKEDDLLTFANEIKKVQSGQEEE